LVASATRSSFRKSQPRRDELRRRAHSPIHGPFGASGRARLSTAGSDDSATIRYSGAVTNDISGNDGRAPSATGDAADHSTPLDGRDAVGARGRVPRNTACPGRSRALGSATLSRANSPACSDGSGTTGGNGGVTDTFGDGSRGPYPTGRASDNTAFHARSSAVSSAIFSQASSGACGSDSSGTSSPVADHDASGSRHVAGRSPADPNGVALAGIRPWAGGRTLRAADPRRHSPLLIRRRQPQAGNGRPKEHDTRGAASLASPS
jgi:hypothetical protein